MAHSWKLLPLALCALFVAGCASGPKYSAIHATFPALTASTGRIYFYRTAVVGAAIQPDVTLNGQKIGKAEPDGFFYVDRPAGHYEVQTSTEVKRDLTLTLDPGQTRYVRFGVSMGFFVAHVYPELVANATAEQQIADCSYMGSQALATKTPTK